MLSSMKNINTSQQRSWFCQAPVAGSLQNEHLTWTPSAAADDDLESTHNQNTLTIWSSCISFALLGTVLIKFTSPCTAKSVQHSDRLPSWAAVPGRCYKGHISTRYGPSSIFLFFFSNVCKQISNLIIQFTGVTTPHVRSTHIHPGCFVPHLSSSSKLSNFLSTARYGGLSPRVRVRRHTCIVKQSQPHGRGEV